MPAEEEMKSCGRGTFRRPAIRLPHALLPNPEREAMRATGTEGNIQHPPGAVELVQKTAVELGLSMATTGELNFGGKMERGNAKSPIFAGKTLDSAVFSRQNAGPRPGGGTGRRSGLKIL